MNKNIPLSGGFGNKKTFPRSRFDSLDDTFKYSGNQGKVVTVRGDGLGLTAQDEAIIDEYKVKISSDDTTPDFLSGKLAAGTGLTQTVQSPAGDETQRIDLNAVHPTIGIDGELNAPKVMDGSLNPDHVNAAYKDGLPSDPCLRTLGTLSNQACAGDDARLTEGVYWKNPATSIFDPTTGFPADAVSGDRYIAKETAGTWTKNKIYKCLTNTWLTRKTGIAADQEITCITVDGTKIFVGTSLGNVYLSTDEGLTWTLKNSGLPAGFIHDLFYDQASSLALYAASVNGIYRSFDSGDTWLDISGSLSGQRCFSVKVSGSTIVAAVYHSTPSLRGIYTYTGESWVQSTIALTGNRTVAALSLTDTGGVLIAGTYQSGGLFRSADSGATWTSVLAGVDSFTSQGFTFVPGYIYCVKYGAGVLRSDDNGLTWNNDSTGIDTTLEALTAEVTVIWGGTPSGAYYTAVLQGLWLHYTTTGLSASNIRCIKRTGPGVFVGTVDAEVFLYSGPTFEEINPAAGWSIYNKDDNQIYTFNGSAWLPDASKTKTSASDKTLGYLVAKLEAGMAMQVTEDTTDPDNYKARLAVSLGTQTDQAAAGNIIVSVDTLSDQEAAFASGSIIVIRTDLL